MPILDGVRGDAPAPAAPPTPPPSSLATRAVTARASNSFRKLPPGATASVPLPAASRRVSGAKPGTRGGRSPAVTPSVSLGNPTGTGSAGKGGE